MLIHIIPLIIFKRKELKNNRKHALYKAFIKFLGSVMYLSSEFGSIYYITCWLKNYRTKINSMIL